VAKPVYNKLEAIFRYGYMETLKTAVIGIGNMGQHHARVYSELNESELVGISDLDINRANTLAAKYGTTAFKDYKEMLIKVKPDCVSVVVPTTLHAKIGCEVLEKSNALVEKPIALTEEDARTLIQSSKDNETMLMVGHIERYNPVITFLKEYLKKSKLLALTTMRLGRDIPPRRTTGVILDLGIHDIDIVRYLTGEEPTDIYASSQKVIIDDFEDHAHILLKMPSSSASIVVNWISPTKIRHSYAVLDKEFMFLNYITQRVTIYEKGQKDNPLLEEEPKKVLQLKKQEPLVSELTDFLGSVRNNEKSPISGEDALASLKIAIKAERGL